jgi:hypothetical protein
MNPFRFFSKLQPFLKASDWALAVVSLGYGLYRMNWWWIGAAVIMFALAWFDPGTRITRYFAMVKPAPGAARPPRKKIGKK